MSIDHGRIGIRTRPEPGEVGEEVLDIFFAAEIGAPRRFTARTPGEGAQNACPRDRREYTSMHNRVPGHRLR